MTEKEKQRFVVTDENLDLLCEKLKTLPEDSQEYDQLS
jgi:hypothetical protein